VAKRRPPPDDPGRAVMPRIGDGECRRLIAVLDAIQEHVEHGHLAQAFELLYQGREGWVVKAVGWMRTDDVDALCATLGQRPHTHLVDALQQVLDTMKSTSDAPQPSRGRV